MDRSVLVGGFVAALGLLQGAGAAFAQDAPAKALSIELNKATDAGAGCRLTFVAKNGTDVDLTKTTYEIAFFNADGQVASLGVFAFNGMAKNRTRVFEFQYADLPCKSISQVLINNARECQANGASSPVCLDALKTNSRTPIAFNQ